MSELSSIASLECSSQLVRRFSGSPSFLPYRVGMCVTHLLGLGNGLGYVAECFCECNLLPLSVQYAPSVISVLLNFF